MALGFALAIGAWILIERDYYGLALHERARADEHDWLRPAGTLGLACGIAAVAMVAWNLLYLARRAELLRLRLFSLQRWMTSHVVTGILALLFALVHAAMAPRATLGGHALVALVVLVVSGAMGATSMHSCRGRPMDVSWRSRRCTRASRPWPASGTAAIEISASACGAGCRISSASAHWRSSSRRRVRALLSSQRELRRTLRELEHEGRDEGVSSSQMLEILALARDAHRASVAASHFEDLRALMSTWRYVHRWVALYMVLIVAVHVVVALRYARWGS